MFDRDTESWVEIEKSYESEGKWIVEGWASTSETDSEDLRMTKEALEDMRKEFEVMRTVLHNHNRDEEIGTVLETDLRKKSSKPEIWGCWVKVLISKTVPAIWQKIQEKVLNKFSVRGKAKIQELFESGRIIQEAVDFVGAELSLVSVPALRAATVEEVYIEKLLKSLKKGRSPMSKELEKISLKDAKAAISDLVKNDEEKAEVMKVLDAMEESSPEKEVEKIDLKTAKERIETLIEDGDAKSSIMNILDSVEETVEKEEKEEPEEKVEKEEEEKVDPEIEKAIAKAKEEHEVMESLAGGLKTLYEKVKAAAGKDAEEALKDLKTIAEQMKKLVEAYPYETPATAKDEEEESEEKEEEKVEKDKTSEADLALGKFAEALENINKSLETAAKNVHDEQVVKMGEMIVGIEEKVEKLTNVIENEVPIRKALVDSKKKRAEVKKTVIDSDEYKEKTPAEKLRTLFEAPKESSE